MKITRLVHGEEITGKRDVTDARSPGGGIMTEPETATPLAKQPGRLVAWLRAHRLAAAGLGVVVLLVIAGAGAGGWAITQTVQHNTALEQAQSTAQELQTAEAAYSAGAQSLTDELTEALTLHDALVAALTAAAADLEPKSAEALASELDVLQELVEKHAVAGSTAEVVALKAAPSFEVDAVDPALSTSELDQIIAANKKAQKSVATEAAANEDAAADLVEVRAELSKRLQEAIKAVPPLAEQLLATNGSAGQAVKDAFAASLKALTEADPADDAVAEALTGYAAAATALRAAHAAEEARKAQEAAADNGTGPGWDGSGNTDPGNGSWYNGDDGSGNTGSDNGGNTGGGDTNRYVQTNSNYLPMDQCPWAGAYMTHDPGPGGTSAPSFGFPWSYENMGSYIQFYSC